MKRNLEITKWPNKASAPVDRNTSESQDKKHAQLLSASQLPISMNKFSSDVAPKKNCQRCGDFHDNLAYGNTCRRMLSLERFRKKLIKSWIYLASQLWLLITLTLISEYIRTRYLSVTIVQGLICAVIQCALILFMFSIIANSLSLTGESLSYRKLMTGVH